MTKSASREKNTLIIQLRLLMRSCPKVPEQSAPPTVGCLRQTEESSTMIISFSLHNSCSNKMCQVILTKPVLPFYRSFFAVSGIIYLHDMLRSHLWHSSFFGIHGLQMMELFQVLWQLPECSVLELSKLLTFLSLLW